MSIITTAILLVKNLWTIGLGLPKLVAYIAPVIRIIGSEEFQKLMSSIYDAVVNALHQVRKESPEIPQAGEKEPLTRGQRLRVVERIKRHIGLAWAGISEDEFVAFRNFKNNNSNDV